MGIKGRGKIRKRRIWHPIPAPWRPRFREIAEILDMIQRNIEISIGRKKGEYSRYFTIKLERPVEEIEQMAKILKLMNPDLKETYVGFCNPESFTPILSGLVVGVIPKFKRMRIPERQNGRSTKTGKRNW